MPAQPACFHRLDEILGTLRSMTSTHLDRAAVEKLFRVRQRRARWCPRLWRPPTWWREALSDRHGRGRRQRVAGALRPARKNKNAAKSPGAVKDESVYLGHIRDAISDIQTYASVDRATFIGDRMRQDAVIRKLESVRPRCEPRRRCRELEAVGHEHIRPTRKVAWCITVPTGMGTMEIPVRRR